MAGNTIEAKLRIAAEVAQAIAALKQVRDELLATSQAAAQAAQPTAGGPDAVVAQIKTRSGAERAAAAETKRLTKERLDAEKAAAKESKALADEEAKRKRTADVEEARRLRGADDAAKKAARNKSYKAAALAPQLTDIGVGLATGQNPLMVALQQGGQLRDIYGSFGGVLKALTSVLTPLRIAMGAAAAVVGVFAFEIAAGYLESSQLNKTLALTGNIAGTSLGQISGLAQEISAEQSTSIGFVRDALAALLTVNGQTRTTMGATGRAATALAKLTGQSAEEAIKGFADQADGVTDWAVKANKAYHFLTASQVAYIRSLESQGRTAEAIKFTNEKLADSLVQRTGPALGALEKGWNAVAQAIGKAADKLKEFGRDETAKDRLVEARRKLAEFDHRVAGPVPDEQAATRIAGHRQILLDAIQAANREMLRGSDAAAAQRNEDELIYRQSKEFQDSLATLNAAGVQKRLAAELAALDKQQSALELAHEREIISEGEKNQELNRLDEERLKDQQKALREQIGIKEREKPRTPVETNSKAAAITQLEGQFVELQSRLQQAAGKGDQILAAEARALADQAVDVWKRALEKLRDLREQNAKTAASRTADPAERARLEADAQISALREQQAQLQNELTFRINLTIDPAQAAKLQRQLDELKSAGATALAELGRKAQLDSLFQQSGEAFDALALKEQQIDRLVAQGAITTEDAEQRKIAARKESLPQLEQILALQEKLALGPAETNQVGGTAAKVGEIKNNFTDLEKTLRGSVQGGFQTFFSDVLTGSETALGAFKKFASGIARSMLDLIGKKLGEQLVNSLFGSSTASGGNSGGWLAAFAQIFAGVKHSGGVIGSGMSGAARAVSPLVFAGAQVLHGGGMVGLAADERPIIARVGEEMLTADDPRHVNNFRGNGVTMNMSVTINGAQGNAQDQRAQVDGLQQMMLGTIEQWASTQRRQGGFLAGR